MTLKRYLKATLDVYLIKKNFADEKKKLSIQIVSNQDFTT